MYGRYHLRERDVDELIELVDSARSATHGLASCRAAASAARPRAGARRRIRPRVPRRADDRFRPGGSPPRWSTIRSLCQLGKTVFLTTHFMDEAQTLADRVAGDARRCDRRRRQARGDRGRDLRPAEIPLLPPAEHSAVDLPDLPGAEVTTDSDRVLVRTRETVAVTARITAWALEHEIALGHFSVTQPSLEDIYLALTRRRRGRRCGGGSNEHEHGAGSVAAPRPHARSLAGSLRAARLLAQPRRAFFSFLMPIMFLIIFATIYHGQTIAVRTARSPTTTSSFRASSPTASSRRRSPTWQSAPRSCANRACSSEWRARHYQAGPMSPDASAQTLMTTAEMTLVVLAIGRIAYGVQVRLATLPGLLAALILGSATFTALGSASSATSRTRKRHPR